MKKNIIHIVAHLFVIEMAKGYQLVEVAYEDYEILGTYKSMAAAREAASYWN